MLDFCVLRSYICSRYKYYYIMYSINSKRIPGNLVKVQPPFSNDACSSDRDFFISNSCYKHKPILSC